MFTFRPFESSSVQKLPDPDTGHMHVGTTRAELVSRIMNYRSQNALPPIERLDLVIDNYLCTLPENAGKCKPLEVRRGLMQYIKGGLVLVQNLMMGKKNIVAETVSRERAAICKECKFNVKADESDNFISWSDEIAYQSLPDDIDSSAHRFTLFNCVCCSCPLRVKIWAKGPFPLSKEERAMMESANVQCWQLRESKEK